MTSGVLLRLVLVQGDITRFPANAIVTSSNLSLCGNRNPSYWRFAGHDNVDGAIRRALGTHIMWLSAELPQSLPEGHAVVSAAAGQLTTHGVRFLVHTNVPEGAYGNDEQLEAARHLLGRCYNSSWEVAVAALAVDSRADGPPTTLAFPALGCGVRQWNAGKA